MDWIKKVRWFPQPEKKVYAMMYSLQMLASYFGTMALIIGLFFIPLVEEITGVQPWEIALAGGMHFCFGMLPQMLFRKMDMSRFQLWETFSDRFVMSSIALFGNPDASFLWLFLGFICVIDAVAIAPSVYSAAMVFIAPFTAWVFFIFVKLREFYMHDFWVVLIVCILTLLLWIFVNSASAEYRGAQREVENSRAQAELERRRAELSRDIHDAVAAIFTRILSIQKDESSETASLTREGLKQLRDIVTALQVENTSLGFLVSWLNHHSQQYFENTGIRADFKAEFESTDAKMEPIGIIHVMRIFQELCQNSLKHSGASEVTTVFHERDNRFSLEFSDNGKGFLAQSKENQGLKNMHERARELGAVLSVTKNVQGGTIARIAFSISPTPNSGD